MRSIEWSNDALDDFDDAMGYLARESPAAADTVAERLLDAIDMLADMPTGRQGRVRGTYERFVPHTSYVVAYAVSERTITILRVIHAKRDWPAGEWPAG